MRCIRGWRKKNATKVVSFLIHRQLIPPNSFHLPSHPRHSCSHSLAHFLRSLSLSWHHCSTRYIIGKKIQSIARKKMNKKKKKDEKFMWKILEPSKNFDWKMQTLLVEELKSRKSSIRFNLEVSRSRWWDDQNPLFGSIMFCWEIKDRETSV